MEETPTILVSAIACIGHPRGPACRYQVAWTINPHMAIGSVDFTAAAAEHAAYVSALQHAGATVVTLPFVHGAYDSVFAKDTALVLERRCTKKVLLAQPRHPERQREQVARSDFFERAGYEVVCDLDGPSWEGGDTVMLPRGLLLCFIREGGSP